MLAALLFIINPSAQAQCLGGSPITLMPGQSAVAGGQFTNGFLIAPPAYYQPLNYYAPSGISQPMVVPCTPGFRTGVIPFNHGLQMPNQNPWAAALPALMGSVGDLGALMFRSNDEASDFDTFRARRESDRRRERTDSSFESSSPAPAARSRPLEFESRYVELPRSNTAANLGLGGVEAPVIEDRGPVIPEVAAEAEPEPEIVPQPEVEVADTPAPPTPVEEAPAVITVADEDFIGPMPLPAQPDPDLDLDSPPPTDRVVPAVVVNADPPTLGEPPSVESAPITPAPIEAVPVLTSPPALSETAVMVDESLRGIADVGLPPMRDCEPGPLPAAPTAVVPQLVQGAYQVMNTFYQSCSASDIIIDRSTPIDLAVLDEVISVRDETRRSLSAENRNRFIEHHPILSSLQTAPQCQDILETPALFSFGAKPLIRRQRNGEVEMDLFQDQSQRCSSSNIECDSLPVIAMDCSGFIQASMVASGHKIYPDQRDHQERGTSGFLSAALSPESCLKPAGFEVQDGQIQTLKPGDLVTVHAHHMYMITDVGPDPLGIQRALDRGDCQSLDMNEFDFKFIQSGATGSLGVARMSSNSPLQSEIIQARLFYQAKKTCLEIQNNQPLSAPIEQSARRTEFMVIRHDGPSRPECMADPAQVKIRGQECLEQCESAR